MDTYLQELRKKCLIGLVGGSDITKIAEQIGGIQGKIFISIKAIFDFLVFLLSYK